MDLKLEDFTFHLPEDKIAKYPLKERSDSKLLLYKGKGISHHQFKDIDNLIPKDSLLVFNDTKVIPARIVMYKASGARIEIFLLEPIVPSKVHEEIMNTSESCTWKCLIGNAKKWKQNSSLDLPMIGLKATRSSQDEVTFSWGSSLTFSDLLSEIGKIPLPPYIDREVEEQDRERYQTVYSKSKGAVAAPTAGLHFTTDIIDKLKAQGIQTDYLTLHVSAGTFQPIKSDRIEDHPMHNEQIWISRKSLEKLIIAQKIIAVGTTSMRTLESIYWYGVRILAGKENFHIDQKDAYKLNPVDKRKALKAVLDLMDKKGVDKIGGHTEIFIYPGYQFQMCEGLVTNYHLPGSTLILLVASFIGNDWKKVYQSALNEGYRFLSYGDSSLLLP